MDIADCYRLLELNSTANLDELKTSYRRLARQLHPDVNPGNQQAHERFIQVTRAYKYLLKVVPAASNGGSPPFSAPNVAAQVPSSPSPSIKVSVRRGAPAPSSSRTVPQSQDPQPTPPSSAQDTVGANNQTTPWPQATAQGDRQSTQAASSANTASSTVNQKLKHESYQQLQELIKHKRFPRAIALVEALAQRFPQDREVRQWQGIIYQRWGRQLIQEGKPEQARAYLKKALSTDRHNRSLWAEVERDFRQLEKIF